MTLLPSRVLIVDDSEEATGLLAALISRRGHQVRVAHDVEQGLRAAKEFKPDVALLDIMIRLESGLFLGSRILEAPETQRCRLVSMTGFGLEQHRKASEAVGFRWHLSKPIDPVRLFAAIEAPEER